MLVNRSSKNLNLYVFARWFFIVLFAINPTAYPRAKIAIHLSNCCKSRYCKRCKDSTSNFFIKNFKILFNTCIKELERLTMPMPNHTISRLRITISGQVQGVGFRPFCHTLAQRFNLSGWVRNHGGGVDLEIQGMNTQAFLQSLSTDLPAGANIEAWAQKTIPINNHEHGFIIRDSVSNAIQTNIPTDSHVCNTCLKELFDPSSRYYRYAFISCSHCGPRFTLVKRLPFDRFNTSMAKFNLCNTCSDEYQDINNRRNHAQTIACSACGPRLSMSIEQILQRINAGEILAIKGLGGFHLICDAQNHSAVKRLRARKNRDAKPFAIMAANIQSLEEFVYMNEAEKTLLSSPARPVVLLDKKISNNLSPAVAPGLNSLGVMLPYTPLHYLLFNAAAHTPDGLAWLNQINQLVLVMTSGNPIGEPLLIDNQAAQNSLNHIADTIVVHDRDIINACDDSVMRIIRHAPFFIRRARGFTPQAITLAKAIPSILAVGGHLKNTICVSRGNKAYLSQHIGDLSTRAKYDFFCDTVQQMLDRLQIEPELIAHDLHPDFLSTRFALEYSKPALAVQHHHAHLAAVAAEHHITTPVLGLALDGFGLGENNQHWGGELLLLNQAHYQRLGHLSLLKQAGGDRASQEPWRMAASVFFHLGRSTEIQNYFQHDASDLLSQLLEKNINCPLTSSAGRLFDAAAGLLKIISTTDHEGQAAMMLESLFDKAIVMQHGWHIHDNQLDFLPLLEQLIDCEPIYGANLFHGTLIAGLSQWLYQNATHYEIDTILLSGGCFLNKVLSSGLHTELSKKNLQVKFSRQAPINDGGLSLGQLWVAGLSSTLA